MDRLRGSLLGSLLGLLCTQVCWVKGQQVEQSPVALTVREGDTSALQCTFSSSPTTVQWFYQNPEGSFISLFYNPSGTKRSGRLTCTTVPKERRSSLNVSSSQTTDSGTYFCAMEPQCSADTCSLNTNLQLGVSGQQERRDQQQVKQSPPSLTVPEGGTSVLNCTFESSAFDYFPWYRQLPGKGPELLIAVSEVATKKEEGRFTVFFSKSAKQLSLHITASRPGDSATYLCAARAQCSLGTCRLHANLPPRLQQHPAAGPTLAEMQTNFHLH